MHSIVLLAMISAGVTGFHAANPEDHAGHCLEANAAQILPVQKMVAADDQNPTWDSTPFGQDEKDKNLRRDDTSLLARDMPLPSDTIESSEPGIIIILGQPDTTATFQPNFLEPVQPQDASEPYKRQATTTVAMTSPVMGTSTTTVIMMSPPTSTSTTLITQAASTTTETITSTSDHPPQVLSSHFSSQASIQRSSLSYWDQLAKDLASESSRIFGSLGSKSASFTHADANAKASLSAVSVESKSLASSFSSESSYIASRRATASKSAEALDATAKGSSNLAAVSRQIPSGLLTGSMIAAIALLGFTVRL